MPQEKYHSRTRTSDCYKRFFISHDILWVWQISTFLFLLVVSKKEPLMTDDANRWISKVVNSNYSQIGKNRYILMKWTFNVPGKKKISNAKWKMIECWMNVEQIGSEYLRNNADWMLNTAWWMASKQDRPDKGTK